MSSMPDRDLLSRWEEVHLLSIWELREEAYGVGIKKSEGKGRCGDLALVSNRHLLPFIR